MSMIEGSDDSVDAATGYTNVFLDAAVKKIDGAFGAGFAKANPALVGALVQASATNLVAFMQAATAMDPAMFDQLPEELYTPPPPKSGKGRR